MGITLKTFREITNGFARGCHFNIGIIDWKDPKFGQGPMAKVIGTASTPLLSAFCSGTELPSRTISTHDIKVQHGIPPIKIGNEVGYAAWTLTFYCDEIAALRYFFLRWQESLFDTTTKSYNVPKAYKSTLAYAALLTPQDIPCQVYTFRGLFPTDIGSLSLSQGDSTVLSFSVTFAYDFFEVNETVGFALAGAHEFLGSSILNFAKGNSTPRRKRNINAPGGLSLPLPKF